MFSSECPPPANPLFDQSRSIFIRNIRQHRCLELNLHFCNIGQNRRQIERVFSNSQHTAILEFSSATAAKTDKLSSIQPFEISEYSIKVRGAAGTDRQPEQPQVPTVADRDTIVASSQSPRPRQVLLKLMDKSNPLQTRWSSMRKGLRVTNLVNSG